MQAFFGFSFVEHQKLGKKGRKVSFFGPKIQITIECMLLVTVLKIFFFQMLSRIDLCYFAKFIQISKRNFHLKFLMCIWPLFFFFFQGFTRAHIFCEITMKNAKQWYKFCCQIRSRSRLDRPHSCVSCKK